MSAETADILESLGPARRFADPASPLDSRLMAASGALPLPPPQLLSVLVALTLDPDAGVKDKAIGSLRALAACFGFPGDDVEKRCRLLSGGEKVRLVMARMLYDPPNFLVLDEPTNHLDLATKEMLIAALADFEGTLLMVSHDRHFLAAPSNRVLELEPGGAHSYGAGYAEYVVASGHEAPGMRGQ